MLKMRRKFSPEFKRETVALPETTARPLMQVATEVAVPTISALTISPSFSRSFRRAASTPHRSAWAFHHPPSAKKWRSWRRS